MENNSENRYLPVRQLSDNLATFLMESQTRLANKNLVEQNNESEEAKLIEALTQNNDKQ